MLSRILLIILLFSQHAFSQTGFNSGADSMLNFLLYNKSRASIYIQKNGQPVGKINEDRLVPLAGTVKIMIALEFAKQVGAEVIDEEKYVALNELDKYHVYGPDTDDHVKWIEEMKNRNWVKDDSVKLLDVARGMIMYNSNANTEYLIDILGFDNVKNNIQLLGLKAHTAIFPMVSSMFMYQNPHKLKEEKVLKEIESLTEEQYCKYIFKVHAQLKWDSAYKNRFCPDELSPRMQKLWSDRLPASSAREYVKICQVLNNRSYFDGNTYGILAEVLETFMENANNRTSLKHAGYKSGSTRSLFTQALYVTTKDDSKYEMAFFINNLNPGESLALQRWNADFKQKLLTDEVFRKRLVALN